jgi:hypothetical protein
MHITLLIIGFATYECDPKPLRRRKELMEADGVCYYLELTYHLSSRETSVNALYLS